MFQQQNGQQYRKSRSLDCQCRLSTSALNNISPRDSKRQILGQYLPTVCIILQLALRGFSRASNCLYEPSQQSVQWFQHQMLASSHCLFSLLMQCFAYIALSTTACQGLQLSLMYGTDSGHRRSQNAKLMQN